MDLQCSICFYSFKDKHKEISSSKCGHIYHNHCIVDWIQRSKTCPDCRTPLTSENIFKLYLFSAESSSRPEDSLGLEIERLKTSNLRIDQQNAELNTRIAFLELQLEEKTKTHDILQQRFSDLENTRQSELNLLNHQFISYRNQVEQYREALKCEIENLQKENLTIRTKISNVNLELEDKTKTYNELQQKYHTLVKANECELRRKERQFVNYKTLDEKNIDSLKSQIGKLQREARSFRTKIGDLEWELDKKTKTHNDLLLNSSKMEQNYQRVLIKKDHGFVIRQAQNERNIRSLKSQIEKLQMENKALRKTAMESRILKKRRE